MTSFTSYSDIDRTEWSRLVQNSTTGTWFQTPEAYDFFASQPNLFQPFVVAVSPSGEDSQRLSALSALCMGYVTVEHNSLKQFLTRRAIIIGGPALASDCSINDVQLLMSSLTNLLQSRSCLSAPIYIETRNFNDYSPWREGFEKAGFCYEPHLNFQVHTDQPWDTIEGNIGKHRKKYIRLSYRDGASVVDHPTLDQVKDYYDVLLALYRTKVKMPLQPWSFFERLYRLPSCRYILVKFDGHIVGGSVCMSLPNHGIYEWFACGKDGEHKNIYPSSVTKYEGMKYAFDNGYPLFDMMGAGKPNEEYGVRDFKAEFGGEMVQHGRYKHITQPLLYKCGEWGVRILRKIK